MRTWAGCEGKWARFIILLFWLGGAVAPAKGKVLVHWTAESVPARDTIGASELVIPWSAHASKTIELAKKAGFEVYVESAAEDAAAAASAISQLPAAGLIVSMKGNRADVQPAVEGLRKRYPRLSILVLDATGKQPMMRGQTITTENGILQVSSPTAQPWLDSNLALARFDQEFYPEQRPLYTFQWEAGDSVEQANGIAAENYCLAIAESAAIESDLLLNVDDVTQKRLLESNTNGLAGWSKVKSCLSFSDNASARQALANVGVMTEDFESAYEAMNLMGRHNLPYRVLRAGAVQADKLEGLDVLAVFTSPTPREAELIQHFADGGGTAVLVDVHGNFPWKSVTPVKTADQALSYSIGKGRVIELAQSVDDPETFAQDIRRLIPSDRVLISAWNALTTLAVPYKDGRSGDTVVELVNYSEQPLEVQVRVKGPFSSIRYAEPGQTCCESLNGVHKGDFTEFVVPSLRVAGRVFLKGE